MPEKAIGRFLSVFLARITNGKKKMDILDADTRKKGEREDEI